MTILNMVGGSGGGGEVTIDALCFTANTAGSTVQLTTSGSPTSVTLQISRNGTSWETYTIGNTITLSNVGDKVYFRNSSETDTGFSNAYNKYYKFVMTGSIDGSGDVTYLINKNGTNTLSNYCFYHLFDSCNSLKKSPRLPATNLAQYCYGYMFYNNTGITITPELPATTLANYCYYYMFRGCTSLTTALDLPATVLGTYCYQYMFYGCTSLTKVPSILPATTLTDHCYGYMFYGCDALEVAPILPATTLHNNCYESMFVSCDNLKIIQNILPATTLTNSCYKSMFSYCVSLTAVPTILGTTLASQCCMSMFSSCTGLTSLPKLPATTLATNCYNNMFNNCSSIKLSTSRTGDYQTPYRIPITGTGTTADDAMYYMFNGTTGSWTGRTPSINTTYYTTNSVV